MRRVVITGMGIISPIGNSIKAVMDAFNRGRSGITRVEDWEKIDGLGTRVAGVVQGINPKSIPRKHRRTMGLMAVMASLASLDAVKDAGLEDLELASERTGVSLGSTTGSPNIIEDMFVKYADSRSIKHLEGTTFLKIMSHTVAANVASLLKTRGRLISTCAACASSTEAVGIGFELIRAGHQDIMICGGAEELHPSTAGVFDVVYAASKAYNDRPSKTPRPFDKGRDGLVVGEGAGVVVLEDFERAVSRNAEIYGEIAGYGSCCDGSHMTTPGVRGMLQCMEQALAVAGIEAQAIDYINAHATGTTIGDAAEAEALREFTKGRIPVSATKGYTGHTLAASGAMEVIFSLLMMKYKMILPTLNLDIIDPLCEGIFHVMERIDKELKYVMTNNFAFGGVNASLILKSVN